MADGKTILRVWRKADGWIHGVSRDRASHGPTGYYAGTTLCGVQITNHDWIEQRAFQRNAPAVCSDCANAVKAVMA